MHKRVKEAAGLYRKRNAGLLCDEQGNTIFELEEKLKDWEKHITTLFDDDGRPSMSPEITALEGPIITIDEIQRAINSSKNYKATGLDEILCGIYKMINDDKALKILTDFFNNIYVNGCFPTEWTKSVFIPIPKKRSAKTCNHYRTISLMNYLLKIFLKVIHGRIYRKCELYLSGTQFGFRSDFGTREALFRVNVPVNMYPCFIDFRKARNTDTNSCRYWAGQQRYSNH